MSLLFPAIRTAVRASLLAPRPATSPLLLLLRRPTPHLHPAATLAPFSRALASRTYATKPPQSSEAPPPPPEDTKSQKDTLSGDVPVAPGGILAELTGAESSPPTHLEAASEDDVPLKRADYISSADRKRERIAKYFYWASLLGLVGGSIYLGRPMDEKEKEHAQWHNLREGHSPLAYWERFRARTKDMIGVFQQPAFEKILADKPSDPYGVAYTLVLDLEDLLVHAEWTREHGWRTAKRPGVDYFLGYLAQFYEIVVFSSQYAAFSAPIVDKLDPYRTYWSGYCSREHTRYIDGKVVKDLSHLNRDLSKVIIIDTNPDAVSLQPENAIVLSKWKGDIHDKGLISLLPFLEYLASQNFQDLRPILTDYNEAAKTHHITIPEEFAHREQLMRAALQKNRKETGKSPAAGTGTSRSFISKLFGLKPPQPQLPVEIPEEELETLTPLDYTRMAAQGGYAQLRKFQEENGERILEEQKKQIEQLMAEQKVSLFGQWLRLKGKEPEKRTSEKETVEEASN